MNSSKSTEYGNRKEAERYIKENNVDLVVQHLLASLLYARPDNPRQFLMEEVRKMQFSKAQGKPTMFNEKDVNAYFHILDTSGKGYIDHEQYVQAFHTLGMDPSNTRPEGHEISKILKDTFVIDLSREIFNMSQRKN